MTDAGFSCSHREADGLFARRCSAKAGIRFVSFNAVRAKRKHRDARRPIPSLVTGCAAEIEYHALDDDHLIFALNNSLYRLKRTHAGIPGKKL